ncbi:protein HEG isoform X2 [Eleginops maclovinus]|uniref:protein HEG isoform X2 n=1 Tax=Eleginops maclovinus TaxID=56733 RepID=UPI003080C8B5
MVLSYLPFVFLLGAAVKGMTTTDPITQNVSTDGGMIDKTSTSPATSNMNLTESSSPSSSHSTSSFLTSPPSTTEHFTATVATVTTKNATAESSTMKPDSTYAETTLSQPSYFTPGSPTDSPSAPISGTTLSTTSPETSQPTNTMTNNTTLTQSTEPSSGDTTASSTTLPNPTSTISTGTIISDTTLRPTEITTTDSTTAAPPIPPVIVCPSVPCPLESICLNGTCQCLSGSFLVNGRCAQAQVFPGQLHITSLTFEKEMSNRSSVIFLKTAAQISASLRNALKNHPGYKQSDVVELKPGSVQATVNNIFENTNTTQKSIDQAIREAIANPANTLLTDATFTGTNLCVQEPLPCDVSTTLCTNTNGRAVCSCREGYISILYSNSSCKACPSGLRAVGHTCEPCAFGYAGFNCNDSALLAVVVVSCVLGGVVLILLLALLIYCFRMRSSNSKPHLSRSPYSSGDLNQPWPTGITPIPRATSNWDAAPPIEMTDGGSTHVLVDKNHQTNGSSGSYDLNPDGLNTFKGKNPSRYSYLVQGHENPYFLSGDDKKN